MTGVFPHFRTLAKLVQTDVKEVKSRKPYNIFDVIVSSNARAERSMGLSENYV